MAKDWPTANRDDSTFAANVAQQQPPGKVRDTVGEEAQPKRGVKRPCPPTRVLSELSRLLIYDQSFSEFSHLRDVVVPDREVQELVWDPSSDEEEDDHEWNEDDDEWETLEGPINNKILWAEEKRMAEEENVVVYYD
jgi:hypothetical protein